MTPIKRKLLYIFRGQLLRLRITWNHGVALTLSIGYHVDKTDDKGKPKWDGNRCRLNTTHGQEKVPAHIINKALENIEESISNAFFQFEQQDIVPTKEELKALLNPERSTSVDLFQAFDEYIQEGKSNRYWYDITRKVVTSRRNLLYAFDKDLKFTDISSAKLHEFVNFLTKKTYNKGTIDGKPVKVHYNNSYIIKTLKIIKGFLLWSRNKGYIKDSDFMDFKPTLKAIEKPVIYLSWEELMKVYNYDFSLNKRLEAVRDTFCFCCFTSLRYSDMKNLRKANVSKDHLTIVTQKTANNIIIDLNKYSRAILEKYAGTPSEMALPAISQQKMNDYLKEIAKICEIDTPIQISTMSGNKRTDKTVPKYELISSHCGRRTFIVNSLSLGIPPNIVMKWTGHSDYKSMEPYIDIVDDMRKKSMEVFDKK